jgi:hypothetical protein
MTPTKPYVPGPPNNRRTSLPTHSNAPRHRCQAQKESTQSEPVRLSRPSARTCPGICKARCPTAVRRLRLDADHHAGPAPVRRLCSPAWMRCKIVRPPRPTRRYRPSIATRRASATSCRTTRSRRLRRTAPRRSWCTLHNPRAGLSRERGNVARPPLRLLGILALSTQRTRRERSVRPLRPQAKKKAKAMSAPTKTGGCQS